MVDGNALGGGAGGITGAVSGATVALSTTFDNGIVGIGQSSHCNLGLGVHALSADPGTSYSLGILQSAAAIRCAQGHEYTARSKHWLVCVTHIAGDGMKERN